MLVSKETSSFRTKLLMLLSCSCFSNLLSVLSASFPSLSVRETASGSLELLKCLCMLSFFLFPGGIKVCQVFRALSFFSASSGFVPGDVVKLVHRMGIVVCQSARCAPSHPS